jgi:hypothetical protein
MHVLGIMAMDRMPFSPAADDYPFAEQGSRTGVSDAEV